MSDRHLTELLECSREALLAGDLAQLAPLAEEISVALDAALRIDAGPAGPGPLAQVRRLADENSRLLLAAREGIRSARATMMQAGNPAFTSYDAQGRRIALDTGPAGTELRL